MMLDDQTNTNLDTSTSTTTSTTSMMPGDRNTAGTGMYNCLLYEYISCMNICMNIC